jgi:hypothetical protein
MGSIHLFGFFTQEEEYSMKRFFFVALVVMLVASAFTPLFAQGEATSLFLMINPGARQGGMGEAGVAVADDANAIYWNPAGLAFQYTDPEVHKKGEVTLMHVNWLPQFNFSDLYYDFAAARYHVNNVGMLGLAIQFINYGENTQTDDTGEILGQFTSNEVAVTGSYATKLKNNLGLGVNLKFVLSRLSPVEVGTEKSKGVGSTFALDLGFLYHPGILNNKLSVGLNLANFGPKITYIDKEQADPIPTNLRFGFAYKFLNSEYNRLMAVLDLNRLLVPRDEADKDKSVLTYLYSSWGGGDFFKRFSYSGGLEYWYSSLIGLRAGYFYEDPNYGDRQFWTFGGGVRIAFLGVDFSYILASADDHPLSDTMRFSLSATF